MKDDAQCCTSKLISDCAEVEGDCSRQLIDILELIRPAIAEDIQIIVCWKFPRHEVSAVHVLIASNVDEMVRVRRASEPDRKGVGVPVVDENKAPWRQPL